jgi:hypothetical protein
MVRQGRGGEPERHSRCAAGARNRAPRLPVPIITALIGAGAVIVAAIIGASFEVTKAFLMDRPDLRGSCLATPAVEVSADGITNVQFTEEPFGKGSLNTVALICAVANFGNKEARDVVVTFVGENKNGDRRAWSWDLSSIASRDAQRFALIESRSYDKKALGSYYVLFPSPKAQDGATIFWHDAPYPLMFP